MRAVSAALWLAVGGAALQVTSIFTDFYVYNGARQSAWFGVPFTSELILLSALLTGGLIGLTAAGRSPVFGRTVGWVIGMVGSLAALQVAYRMVAPPFGAKVPEHAGIIGDSCLYYCLPWQANAADLLGGMWIALIGSIVVGAGGVVHALWRKEQHAPARPWRAAEQPGMNPWLGLAALGAFGQFVFGYTIFTFYTSVGERGVTTWSGWLPSPHTAWLVLVITVVVVGLVWSAARKRAPLAPSLLGIALAGLGALSAARIAYRVFQPPFRSAVEIGPAAYLALLSAVVIVVAGLVHAGVVSGRQRTS